MKKVALYTFAVLILATFFGSGCKNDLPTIPNKLTGGVSNYPSASSIAISTIVNGYYTFVAPGASGSIYILRGYTDTIYKVDATGNKSFFYTATGLDTAVHKLNCLATDSSGNVYSLDFTSTTAKIIKIDGSGSATTLVDNLGSYNNTASFLAIKVDNTGNVYFTNEQGIYKITPTGVMSQVSTMGVRSFDIDDAGDLIIANENTIGKITPTGVQSIIAGTGSYGSADGPAATASFNIIHQVSCDNKGNIFVSEIKNGYTNQIRVITNTNQVYTLVSSLGGHVDGPISGAKIGTPSFLVNDAASNLYFSEGANEQSAAKNDIRKIAF